MSNENLSILPSPTLLNRSKSSILNCGGIFFDQSKKIHISNEQMNEKCEAIVFQQRIPMSNNQLETREI
jgi:hypothetical protein